MDEISIFKRFYSEDTFVDRFIEKGEDGVDVIIPLLNTNELWKSNLYSFYREIPINRLLIGDGGCTDDSIDIVQEFPRVEIFKQDHFKTLGYSLQRLIERVETDLFIYLHADVYLPEHWYDEMKKHRNDYDWFECYAKHTALIEWTIKERHEAERAYSGSQMGRTAAFKNITPQIDDDFLYRNEDIVLKELIEAEGFKYGRIANTFHYHQLMNKKGEVEPKLKIAVKREPDRERDTDNLTMQAKGIIKYTEPKGYLVRAVNKTIAMLIDRNALDWREFNKWVREVNPVWLKYISRRQGLYLNFVKITLYYLKKVHLLIMGLSTRI